MTASRARVLFPVLCSLFLASALVGYGCGSSSGSGNLCQQSCDKILSLCFPEAGAEGATVKMICLQNCAADTTNCSNHAAITAAAQACLSKTTCDELQACSVPDCIGGGGGTSGGGAGTSGGGAGTSGRGGTTGGGGTLGGGGVFGGGGITGTTTSTCADLLACCNAAAANLKTACMTVYTQAMPSGDQACGIIFDGIKASYCP